MPVKKHLPISQIMQGLEQRETPMPVPDFESGKGYYWMKQVKAAQKDNWLYPNKLPRKPRRTPIEQDFFKQVDKRLSRQTYSPCGISFDKDGHRIHDPEDQT